MVIVSSTSDSLELTYDRQANDPAFLRAAMRYTRDIVITGEVLRFMPSSLQL